MMKSNNIDFIGDIHGYADKLKTLLYKLGYSNSNGYFQHPSRQVIFVGDYIDRGPDNPGVVDIVRKMVQHKTAKAIMGNHEYNAILFNTLGKKGYVRPHSIKNFKQHAATLLQYQGKEKEYHDTIKWFKSLPLYIETDDYRACHASWDTASITHLQKVTKNGVLSKEQYIQSANKSSKLYHAVEITCKGLELPLPKGVSFHDKDGTERHDIRIKWWENPKGKTYKEMSVIKSIKMKKTMFRERFSYYKSNEKPVFFGHYWLTGTPSLQTSNACCLDFSVAKGGNLVAYRFDGERGLDEGKVVYI